MAGKKWWWIAIAIIAVIIVAFFVIRSVTPTDETASEVTEPEEQTETEEQQEETVAADDWSDTFKNSCLTCHGIDENGHVERISDVRKTPEGWQDTISRMQTAWGLEISDEDKEAIIHELSMKNGLAPEEMEDVMYWLTDTGSTFETVEQDEIERMQNLCLSCHAGARALAQYRTEEEWLKLKDFHIGFNPSTVYQIRGIQFEEEAEEILQYLASIQPMESEAWENWKNKNIDYDFSGEWKVIGYRPGYGLYSVDSTITSNDGGYYEERELLNNDGEMEKFEGNVRVFSGYSLRSSLEGGDSKVRGVFNLFEEENVIRGRWNHVHDKGLYADETYYRADETNLFASMPKALKANATETIHLVGSKLPDGLTEDDFTVSDGLTINSVEKQEGDEVWLNVTTDGDVDNYTIALNEGSSEIELASYEQVDYIKVVPEHGFARVQYGDHKQSTQFEAVAYSHGADGEADTEDDIEIGLVDVSWALEEFHEEGDDANYVGEINEFGLFTPAEGGPNPDRMWSANNIGTVNVIATYEDDAGAEHTAESVLVVTLPDYVYVN